LHRASELHLVSLNRLDHIPIIAAPTIPRGLKLQKKLSRKYFYNELEHLFNVHPISIEKAFQVAGVHRTTWARWLSGETRIPPATLQLIKIMVRGDLTDPAFAGFYTSNGVLFDDCGRHYEPGEIRACQYYKTLAFKYLSLLKTHDIIPKRRELALNAQPPALSKQEPMGVLLNGLQRTDFDKSRA
jgi:hypothetical protein